MVLTKLTYNSALQSNFLCVDKICLAAVKNVKIQFGISIVRTRNTLI